MYETLRGEGQRFRLLCLPRRDIVVWVGAFIKRFLMHPLGSAKTDDYGVIAMLRPVATLVLRPLVYHLLRETRHKQKWGRLNTHTHKLFITVNLQTGIYSETGLLFGLYAQ